jgi:hypothetical protein
MDSEKRERRGCPPGAGTVAHNGGRIGNPPYVPTEEMRQNVRTWIKIADAETIAGYMGISRDTLDKYYARELKEGRFMMIATLGAKAIDMAMKGDRTMLIFVLRTQGKWNTRLELTGKDGSPLRHIDISKVLETYSDEQLTLLEPVLEQLLAAGGDSFDFRDQLGDPAAAGGEGAPGA